MRVTKCDRCGKIISDEKKAVHAGFGVFFDTNQFCAKCGDPIARILKRYKLTK